MIKVDLVFFDAGGGHRRAAEALKLIMDRDPFWDVRLLNIQEVFDPLDPARRLTGIRLQDLYNLMLKKNWTRAAPHFLPVLRAAIRYYHTEQVHLLEREWRGRVPDLAVSLIPHFNRAICESLREAAPQARFVTVLTDFADYPPHFWMERQEQSFIVGSTRAFEQARSLGIPDSRIYRTSGMMVHPRFYEPLRLDRGAERERLGLEPSVPTGLVLFGGYGSSVMLEIARRLDRSNLGLQLILICGQNEPLAAALRRGPARLRRHVVGRTAEVPYYMYLSDFFIGKPGPGSISEALLMGLPVIVECNARTLPQERYNAEWITEKQVGIVVPGFHRIDRALEDLLFPARYSRYKANVTSLNNRAVFEVPAILRQIAADAPVMLCKPSK